MMPELNFDQEDLLKLAQMKMPFGKYQGRILADLPEPYLLWFSKQGFPKGELGKLLALMLELHIHGLDRLLDPLKPTRKTQYRFDD
ncbi:DUF3820 family protein [Oceanospirillum sanctuarii]|uniref:DUF3820 family protein n=1 Tax=Oceanospirillum sanctuarii TaxID=1434821 RepID=UPI001FEA692D|nr:DUF3820 family protein [Oceanospirillum sanctuarii]